MPQIKSSGDWIGFCNVEGSLSDNKFEEDSSNGVTKRLSCTSLFKGIVFDGESNIESWSELLNGVMFESLYDGILCDSVINVSSSNDVFKEHLCDSNFKKTFHNRKKNKNKIKIEIKLIEYEIKLFNAKR